MADESMIMVRRVMRSGVVIALITAGILVFHQWRCDKCCRMPASTGPIFGDYTINCVWNGRVENMRVFNLQTQIEPELDGISRFAVRRLAEHAATEALSPAGKRFIRGEIDVRVYGDFFPCNMEIIAVESTPPVGLHVPRVIDMPK